jgi:hypothetical protein
LRRCAIGAGLSGLRLEAPQGQVHEESDGRRPALQSQHSLTRRLTGRVSAGFCRDGLQAATEARGARRRDTLVQTLSSGHGSEDLTSLHDEIIIKTIGELEADRVLWSQGARGSSASTIVRSQEPVGGTAGLDQTDHAERPIERPRVLARRRSERLRRSRGRSRQSLEAVDRSGAVSTLLSAGSQASAGTDTNNNIAAVLQALRQNFGNSLSELGQQIVRPQMNRSPMLMTRPGFRCG